jgi:hypothetical protein
LYLIRIEEKTNHEFDTFALEQTIIFSSMKETNIILSPHLDDAVLSLGCFLSLHKEDTKVVTVFAGIPSESQKTDWDTRCGFKDSTDAVSLRQIEDKNALNLLGLKDDQFTHLHFLDLQYRQQVSNDDNLQLKEKIAEQLRNFIYEDTNNNFNLYGPLFHNHGDHLLVRDVLVFLKTTLNYKNVHYYIYQDFPYVELFESRKRGNGFGIPGFDEIKNYLIGQFSGYNCQECVLPFNLEIFQKKIEAVKLYISQTANLYSTGPSTIDKLINFSKRQAIHLGIDSPYCEVVYEIK